MTSIEIWQAICAIHSEQLQNTSALLDILDKKQTPNEKLNDHAMIIDQHGKDVSDEFEPW